MESTKQIKIEIRNRWTGSVVFEYTKEGNTITETVLDAIRRGANLRDADLRDADLRDAHLRCAHLRDDKGDIQLYVRRDELGEEAYAAFKKLDVGDITGISGTLFRTKTGALTLN